MSEDRFTQPEPEHCMARDALGAGRTHDIGGRLTEAAASYQQAAALAQASGASAVRVEALRRLGVVRHRSSALVEATELCQQSYREALELGEQVLAGEALNALGGFEFEAGEMAGARACYRNALTRAATSPALLGRIEQNLGILDSVQGEHVAAFAHYRRALDAFRLAEDTAGCALAYHNMGLIQSRRGELEEAERSLAQSAALADEVGDRHLASLCELHRAEVSHAQQHYGEALDRAESALASFDRLGDQRAQSDACKVIGKVLRDSGKLALAELRLRDAMALAAESDWVLGQADASRELAMLQQGNGQSHEALALLNEAHELFGRLDARVDQKDVAQRISALRG